MKYGIMYGSFHKDWEGDYAPALTRSAELGFDVLEIHTPMLLEMSDAQLQVLKQQAQDAGVELSFDICLSGETDISADDPAIQKKGIQYITRSLTQIHKLGGNNVGGINYVAWNEFEPGLDKQKRMDNSVRCMKEVIKTAEDYGIVYGLEVTNRFEQFMLNTAQEARKYCARVDSAYIGIHMDINHMMIEERDMYKALMTAGEKLSHFHIAESDRSIPKGGGFLPWQDIARGLKDIGYDRIITLEPLPVVGGKVAQDAKVWRPLGGYQSRDALERDLHTALTFIRGLMS